MKQLRLDKICEIIENNKTISRHLAPSLQTIRLELGFDPKIIVWEDSVTAYVDIDRNVFKKTIQKLKQEHPELIQDIWFHKSDGSCSSWLVFKLNRIEVEE